MAIQRPVYWPTVQAILARNPAWAQAMAKVPLSDDEGVDTLRLGEYASVKRFGKLVAAALDGWQRTPDGKNWQMQQISGQATFIRTAGHPMPPSAPLPIVDVDTIKAWVADGMLESPPVTV
ncbi:MAG: hypothetical protein PW843_16295 [Azospirillaceae bacterium]|nr:hypothetical protein [Azospirillaceae bacterium]